MLTKKPHSFNALSIVSCFLGLILSAPGVGAQDIHVSWSENEEPDLLGYKVYYGRESRRYATVVNVGNATAHTMSELPDYPTIYIAVTAYDAEGNESDYSEEVAVENMGPFFIMMSNYPNPFNPVTRIPFRLMRDSHVEMAVFDVTGRRVRVLMEGNHEAGSYEALWAGDDASGRAVANGVYFCRLLIGDFCITRKLILTE